MRGAEMPLCNGVDVRGVLQCLSIEIPGSSKSVSIKGSCIASVPAAHTDPLISYTHSSSCHDDRSEPRQR